MKSLCELDYNYTMIGLIGLFISLPGFSQLDKTDPFKGNYMLGNSAEIFVIRAAEDTMEFNILDAVGNINIGGLDEKPSSLLLGEWATLEYYSPVTIISGNFNDDKYTDVVAAWQGVDTSVILYIPKIDPSTPDNAMAANKQRVQLFPNPVQAQAVFRYSILTHDRAELSLIDMQGRQIALLFNELRSPGTYDHEISRENLEPGVYFYRFKTRDYMESGKLVILE